MRSASAGRSRRGRPPRRSRAPGCRKPGWRWTARSRPRGARGTTWSDSRSWRSGRWRAPARARRARWSGSAEEVRSPMPHHRSGWAAGATALPPTDSPASRARRTAAAPRTSSGSPGSQTTWRSSATRASRRSARRERAGSSRWSASSTSSCRNRDGCSPSSSGDLTAVTTQPLPGPGARDVEETALLRQQLAGRDRAAAALRAPSSSVPSRVERGRRSGQAPCWTWATTTSRHSRPLDRCAVISLTPSSGSPVSARVSAGSCWASRPSRKAATPA